MQRPIRARTAKPRGTAPGGKSGWLGLVLCGALPLLLTPAIGAAQLVAPRPDVLDPLPGTPGDQAAIPAVPGPDPIIGSVDGRPIYLSDLARASKTLPDTMRNLPFDTVLPVLLDRLIDHEALTVAARHAGLDKDPDVQRDMRAAGDVVLEGAWLARIAPPQATEAAIAARYARLYASRPATEEVRARHILLGSEADAKSVLAELKAGADFAAVARLVSKDPDGRDGGDLGFFRRDQVWAGFADVVFSLRPGQIGQKPIHNEFGWHVVKVEERRVVAPPALSEIREQLRQEIVADATRDAIAVARSQMIIRKFNLDGSEADSLSQGGRGGAQISR